MSFHRAWDSCRVSTVELLLYDNSILQKNHHQVAEDNILCLTLGCLMMKSFYCDLHYFRIKTNLFVYSFIYTRIWLVQKIRLRIQKSRILHNKKNSLSKCMMFPILLNMEIPFSIRKLKRCINTFLSRRR